MFFLLWRLVAGRPAIVREVIFHCSCVEQYKKRKRCTTQLTLSSPHGRCLRSRSVCMSAWERVDELWSLCDGGSRKARCARLTAVLAIPYYCCKVLQEQKPGASIIGASISFPDRINSVQQLSTTKLLPPGACLHSATGV